MTMGSFSRTFFTSMTCGYHLHGLPTTLARALLGCIQALGSAAGMTTLLFPHIYKSQNVALGLRRKSTLPRLGKTTLQLPLPSPSTLSALRNPERNADNRSIYRKWSVSSMQQQEHHEPKQQRPPPDLLPASQTVGLRPPFWGGRNEGSFGVKMMDPSSMHLFSSTSIQSLNKTWIYHCTIAPIHPSADIAAWLGWEKTRSLSNGRGPYCNLWAFAPTQDSPCHRIRKMNVLEVMCLFRECGFEFLPETDLQRRPGLEVVMTVGLHLCALEMTDQQSGQQTG